MTVRWAYRRPARSNNTREASAATHQSVPCAVAAALDGFRRSLHKGPPAKHPGDLAPTASLKARRFGIFSIARAASAASASTPAARLRDSEYNVAVQEDKWRLLVRALPAGHPAARRPTAASLAPRRKSRLPA